MPLIQIQITMKLFYSHLNQAMDDLTDAVANILRQPRRTHTQITSLYEKFGKIEFFRNFSNNDQKATVYEFLSRMKFEEAYPGNVIFFKGEPATKFYIVLEGEVAIFLEEEAGKAQSQCPYPIIAELHLNNPRVFDQQTKTFLLSQVAVQKDGQAFGELGVMQNKPRMATVIATKYTSFGTLSTEDFKAILQPALLNETDVKIKYFKSILDRAFHFDEIWRLTAFFNRVKLEKYSVLAHENQDFTKIFIIAQGAIQLEKNICYDGNEDSYSLGRSNSSEVKQKNFNGLDRNSLQAQSSNGLRQGNYLLDQPLMVQENPFSSNSHQMKDDPLFKKIHKHLINSQPVVVYGQNQFIGFKEFMENKPQYYFTARVLEAGYGYWIHVTNMRRCLAEFHTFGQFFFERHKSLLRILNVSQLGVTRSDVSYQATCL